MAFFSDLWNGIKNVGSAVVDVFSVIVGALVGGIFWLVDRVFDAFDAIIDLFDWLFEKVGEIFSPTAETGQVDIIPNTPAVQDLVKKLEKEGKVREGTAVTIGRDKAAVQVISEGNQVKKVVIAGSEQGFSDEIAKNLKEGNLYRLPINIK